MRVRGSRGVAVGAGRAVGAGVLVVAAAVTLVAIVLAASSVAALQEQAADLDLDEGRAQGSLVSASVALGGLALAILLVGLAWPIYGVSSVRARRRGIERSPAPRVVALVSTGVLFAAVAFAGLSPDGAFYQAAAFAQQEGGAGTVTFEVYGGNLTSAAFAGQTVEEDLHPFSLPAPRGEIRLRMGSGGQGVGTVFAIAVLEEPDGAGGWREVARTEPVADSVVDVPARDYAGDLRLRVRIAEGAAGVVEYALGVSFDPII